MDVFSFFMDLVLQREVKVEVLHSFFMEDLELNTSYFHT